MHVVIVIVSSIISTLFLGPWGYLIWDWLANNEPTTWWRLAAMLVLPLPGGFFFCMVVIGVQRLIQGDPDATLSDEEELERLLSGAGFYIQRTDDPDAPLIKLGTGRDLMGEPKRPLVHVFQHVELRNAAFENHPELIRDLGGARSSWPLLHMWSKARVRCEDLGLLPEGSDDIEGALEEDGKLFDAVSIRVLKRGGYTAYVVTMPPPEHCPESHLVAIVHKDDEPHEYMEESPSTRYFTLEKADISDRPLLCEWRRDGSRENYGEGPAPDSDDFANAVFDRVSAETR
ncbi:MAG: hypothetical protein U0791_27770 [Gemmataceae bacterium]